MAAQPRLAPAPDPDDDLQRLDELEAIILRKLATLAEGRSNAYDRPNLHRVHPGATAPPGANPDRPDEQPPDQDFSLLEYHVFLLNKARERGPMALLRAIAHATLDYETSIKRPPAYLADAEQNAQDRDDAILRWEGRRAEEVAVFEHCSFSYVRKLRKLHNLDPRTGRRHEDVEIGLTTDEDGGWEEHVQ